jgi:hypothetical protein
MIHGVQDHHEEESVMKDTETWAERTVDGGILYLRRPPHGRWEVNYYERELNTAAALRKHNARILLAERLDSQYSEGQTFGSPDEAADAVRQVVAG